MSEIGSSGNSLLPQQTQPAATGAAAGTQALIGATGAAHSALAARYGKIKEVEGRVVVARNVLDSLAKLADTVTQDDVVKAAGRLVAAGAGAAETAGLLAEMPPDGEALAGWVQQKDQGLRQLEATLDEKMKEARYQMGVGALQHIAATQAHQQFGQQAETPPAGPAAANPLLSGVPSGGSANV